MTKQLALSVKLREFLMENDEAKARDKLLEDKQHLTDEAWALLQTFTSDGEDGKQRIEARKQLWQRVHNEVNGKGTVPALPSPEIPVAPPSNAEGNGGDALLAQARQSLEQTLDHLMEAYKIFRRAKSLQADQVLEWINTINMVKL